MGFLSNKLFLGAAIALVVVLAAFGLYFKWSQDRMSDLNADKARLEERNTTLQQSLDIIKADAETLKRNAEDLNNELGSARDAAAQLRLELQNRNLREQAIKDLTGTEKNLNTELRDIHRRIREGVK